MLRVRVLLSALIVTGTLAPPVAAAEPPVARELDRQVVTLTKSMSGMPSSSEPGRQLARAEVEVIHRRTQPGVQVRADITLKGTPSGNPDSELLVGVGWLSGTECQIAATATSRVWATDGTAVRRPGEAHPAPPRMWDCAVVLVQGIDGEAGHVFDAMSGSLRNKYVQPRLAVKAVEVLRKAKKKLRLVRGATQRHTVVIANTGHLGAQGVVITGKGKGVKVKRTVVGEVGPRGTVSAQVPITLKGKVKKTTVRLTVQGLGTDKITRAIPVRRVKPPAGPAAGKWRSTDQTFTFRVKDGAITGFRGVNMPMTCTAPHSYPVHRNVSLTFPKTAVPRHGVVDASRRYQERGVWFNVHLSGKITGTKLVSGRFSYFTGGCSVIEGFKAERIGR